MTENVRNGAILEHVTGVAVGANDVMGDEVAIDVELGHQGRGHTAVGVKAELKAGVVIGTYK